MERCALDERQGPRPSGSCAFCKRAARPCVRPCVLGCELPKRERSSYTPAELHRHGLELKVQAIPARGIKRRFREIAVSLLPLEPCDLDVGRHEAAD